MMKEAVIPETVASSRYGLPKRAKRSSIDSVAKPVPPVSRVRRLIYTDTAAAPLIIGPRIVVDIDCRRRHLCCVPLPHFLEGALQSADESRRIEHRRPLGRLTDTRDNPVPEDSIGDKIPRQADIGIEIGGNQLLKTGRTENARRDARREMPPSSAMTGQPARSASLVVVWPL